MRWAVAIPLALLWATLAFAAPIVRESNGLHFFPDGILSGVPITVTTLDAGGQVFNVKASVYNAKGDGTTDDVGAIQLAVNAACAAGGGVIFYPAGTYIHAPHGLGPMVSIACSHLKFVGAPGAVRKIKDNSLVGGIPGRMYANQDAAGLPLHTDDIETVGFLDDGNDRNNPPASSPFEPEIIECQDCTGFRVHHTRAIDVTARWLTTYRGFDIHVDSNDLYMVGQTQLADPIQINGPNGCTISHNIVENTGEGIVLEHATGTSPAAGAGEATNCVVDSNVVQALPANEKCDASGKPFPCCTGYHTGDSAGFCAAGTPGGGALIILATNSVISNNTIRRHNSINIESGRGFATHNLLFDNNSSTDGTANGYGILVITGAQPNADQPLHDITIQGGRMDSAPSACVGIYSAAINAPYNITIKGLDCLSPVGDGVLFEAGGTGGGTTSAASIQNVSLEHMTIFNPCSGGGTCAGVRFKNNAASPNFTDIVLADSTITDSGRYGIWMVANQTRFDVMRNKFRNNTNGSTNWAAGTINKWIDNDDTDSQFVSAGSVATVNTVVDNNGVTFAAIDPAGIGTGANWWRDIGNGSKVYCSNCTQSEICAGSGTGAQMRKINGLNHCAASPACGSSLFTPIGVTGVDAHATSSVTVPGVSGTLICSMFSPTCNMAATKMSFRLATGTNTAKRCAMAVYSADGTTKVLDTGVIAGATCDTAAGGANVNVTGLTAGQLWAGQNYWACIAFEATATMQYTGLQSGNFFTLYNQIEVHGTNGTNVAGFPGGMPASIGTLTAATPQVPIMAVGF